MNIAEYFAVRKVKLVIFCIFSDGDESKRDLLIGRFLVGDKVKNETFLTVHRKICVLRKVGLL